MYIIPTGLIYMILRKCGEWVCIVCGILAIMAGAYDSGIIFIAIGFIWLFIKRKLKEKDANIQTQQTQQLQQMQQTQQPQSQQVQQPQMNISTNNTSQVRRIHFCPNCGTKVQNDALFCIGCGTKLR